MGLTLLYLLCRDAVVWKVMLTGVLWWQGANMMIGRIMTDGRMSGRVK